MKALVRIALLALAVVLASDCRRSQPPEPSPAPAAPETSTAASMAAANGGGTATASLPLPDLGYNAREGRAVYRHYCATCHGEEGHGDGFNAYNLDPRPRDLGDPAFQSQRTDDDLQSVIRSGGGAAGLSTAMPPWGRTLSEREIGNLVVFLRTLRPDED